MIIELTKPIILILNLHRAKPKLNTWIDLWWIKVVGMWQHDL